MWQKGNIYKCYNHHNCMSYLDIFDEKQCENLFFRSFISSHSLQKIEEENLYLDAGKKRNISASKHVKVIDKDNNTIVAKYILAKGEYTPWSKRFSSLPFESVSLQFCQPITIWTYFHGYDGKSPTEFQFEPGSLEFECIKNDDSYYLRRNETNDSFEPCKTQYFLQDGYKYLIDNRVFFEKLGQQRTIFQRTISAFQKGFH